MKKRLKKKLEKRNREPWRNILKRIKENIEEYITNNKISFINLDNMTDEQYSWWFSDELIYRGIIDINIYKEEVVTNEEEIKEEVVE